MNHRDIQMMCKKPRDVVSDKLKLRTHSLPTPMPIPSKGICYTLSISLIYDSV